MSIIGSVPLGSGVTTSQTDKSLGYAVQCMRSDGIVKVAKCLIFLSFVFLIIGGPILLFGYNPPIFTSDYQHVTVQVIGYGETNTDCGGPCNCRMECRPNRPKCQSWEKHRVCDYCFSPCLMGWVIFSIMPPGPTYTFNAFYDRNYNPLPHLKSQYPMNWTMDAYYSAPSSIVYGSSIETLKNKAIAGTVFTGLGLLLFLLSPLLLILHYCMSKKYQYTELKD